MSILDTIKRRKEEFAAQKEARANLKLEKELARTKREFARAKVREEIQKNKAYVQKVRENEPGRKFLKGLGEKARSSMAARKKSRGAGLKLGGSFGGGSNIYTQQHSGMSSIYHSTSHAGSNPFTLTSSSPVKQKLKKKKVIIYE